MDSTLRSFSQIKTTAFNFGRSVILTSAAVTALVLGLRQIGVLQPAELRAFDQMMRWRPEEKPDERVLLVAVTEEDIQATQEATISDRTLNRLLEKLEQNEPVAIGLDIIRDVPIGEGRAALLKRLKESDRIVSVCDTNSGTPPPPGLTQEQIGTADQAVDKDEVIRRALLIITPPARPNAPPTPCSDPNASLLSLNLQLAGLYLLNMHNLEPEFVSNKSNPQQQDLKLGSALFKRLDKNSGGYQNADIMGYQILLNYRSALNPVRQVTLTDVMQGKVDPAWVKDRIVFVGYTAPSKKDDFVTPYSPKLEGYARMPGVMIHAQIASQVLSTVLNNRPLFWFWPNWVEGLWIAGWALVGGTIAWRLKHPAAFTLTSMVAIGGLVGVTFLIFTQAGWVPVIAPAASLGLTAISIVLLDRSEKIYKTVAKFLNIEIDQAETSRQVSEITETDFFRKLQDQSQEIRQQSTTTAIDETLDPMLLDLAREVKLSEGAATGYVEQLRQRVRELKHQNATSLPEENQNLSYFEQLRQKAADLKLEQAAIQRLSLDLLEVDVEQLEAYCDRTSLTPAEVLSDLIHTLTDPDSPDHSPTPSLPDSPTPLP